MLPNFLIIGAQKAGSTFAHKCIREHPDVFMPRYEIAFFEDPHYSRNDFSQFEVVFDAVRNEKAIGIKRPDYLARPECPERIYKHIPNAKLIVVLRNPIDRAISAYYWFMQVGIIPIRPIEEGLPDIVSGSYDVRCPKAREIVDYGFYYKHLSRYLRCFERSQLWIGFQNDFRADPQQALEQIYRFLEIDESYVAQALTKRPKQSVYSLTRLKWLSMVNRRFFYSYTFDKNNMVALRPVDGKLSKLFYYALVAVDRYLLAAIVDNTRPKRDVYIRNLLSEIYRKDIEALERLLGRELMLWKYSLPDTFLKD